MRSFVLTCMLALLAMSVTAEEVVVDPMAPIGEKDAPLTSVVVTQCNLIVAVYVTMPDGRLLRFDKSSELPFEQLLGMAYHAKRSERVEVSCNENGVVGFKSNERPI